MKTTFVKRMLSAILCIVLVAAVALFTTSCDDNKNEIPKTKTVAQGEVPKTVAQGEVPETTTVVQTEVAVVGKGEEKFSFTVSDIEGNVSEFEIHTDKKTVGQALLELELIKGDKGPYGLYVKEVNGISADFDKDGVYWAFYVDGEYATSGVDMTKIEDGKVYSFKVEKA